MIWFYNVFNKLDLSAMNVNDKEMLLVISRLMRSSHWILKGIAFDAHHSHRFLRDVLLGAFELCSREMISDIEWFKDLDFLPLPPHELPRLPLQICLDHNEPFWCLSGACGLVLKPRWNLRDSYLSIKLKSESPYRYYILLNLWELFLGVFDFIERGGPVFWGF